jgi:membrane protease YdiL (CAAX protease family)
MGLLRYLWNVISLEGSAIGQGLRQSPRLLVGLTAVAVALLVPTFMLTTPEGQAFDRGRGVYHTLATIAALSLGFVAALVPGTAAALGFRWAPKRGWLFWFWVGAALSVVQLIFVVIKLQFFPGISLGRPEALTWQRFLSLCLLAPVAEEILLRMLLCPPAVAVTGSWGGVILSGVAFASLHYVAGVATLDNLMGGFFLAWLFIKSGTILVPIALHSVSNLILLICLTLLMPLAPPVPPVPADKKHPAEEMGVKSVVSSDIETRITFVNKSGQTVKVYWLNFEGHRQLIETVEDGASFEVGRTYLTQPWLVTDENDKAWYVYFADAQPRTVEIIAPEKKP